MELDEERLTTGWEPDIPVFDTMLRRFLFNWTADIEAHASPSGGRTLRREDLTAVDVGRPAGFLNCATLLRPLAADAEEALGALDAFYFAEGRGSGTVVLVSV